MKDRPLLVTAIVFGGIGFVILTIAAIIFISGEKAPLDYIGALIGMEKGRITVGTIAQFSLVFEIMAFIVAYRELSDET